MAHMKQIVVIAGPAGSGKDTIIGEIIKTYPNTTRMVTATTRIPRPGEMTGVHYYFMSNEQFLAELKQGKILEHYHRADTDTYYGTYKPDIDERIKSGKTVLCHVQIVGMQYLKAHYDATSIFIMPPSLDAFERRVRSRSKMSDVEWAERVRITKEEVEHDAPLYDYRVMNEDGKLNECVDRIVAILRKEGYNL
jgi:guanylate kinase